MKKIIISGIVAASAMSFAACSSMNETNSNKAVVVNTSAANSVANSNMMNSNAVMNTNTVMMNSNMATNGNLTRADYDRDKDKYAAEAKSAGRTIGTGANDGWLWTKTKTALATTSGLRDSTINVDVSNAVVTLSGTVATKEQLAAAVKVAQEIEGVSKVTNNLKVQANDSLTNQMTGGNSAANTKTANANHK